MGGKGSKQRKLGSKQSSFVSTSSSADPVARGKSERQENEEARAKRVGMLCQWLMDSDVENEVADFMEQLRELCAELTARLYARTELQVAIVSDADTVAKVTAKAMNQFPENDSIILSGLEIFQFMEAASWENKHDGSFAADQVMRVMENVLTKNQENPDQSLNDDDVDKLLFCADIVKSMVTHNREPLPSTECAQMLLRALKAMPGNARKEFNIIGFLLAEKMGTSKSENAEQMIGIVLEMMLHDGLTLCDVAKRRWSDADDDYVSPLMRGMVKRSDVDINAACSLSGKTALISACETNQRGVATFLMENGADLEKTDNNGRTALMAATEAGHVEIVTLLLDRGARIDSVDKENCTALHLAVKKNDLSLVTVILGRVDENSKQVINAQNAMGMAPLHVAVWERTLDEETSISIVKALVAAGADPLSITPSGASALILAVHRRRNLETLRVILDAGCDKSIKCQGMTAFDVALEEGADEDECTLLKCE